MEDQSYVSENLHPVFEALMMELLVSKPNNIVQSMLNWLENRIQNGSDKEKEEENANISKDLEENRNYITTKIHPIFEKIIVDLLLQKPEQVLEYMIGWLKDKGEMFQSNIDYTKHGVQPVKKPVNEDHPSSEEEEDDEEDYIDEIPLEVLQQKGKQGMRTSVSAEAYGVVNQKQAFKPRKIPKSQEQKDRIIKKLQSAFMFSALSEQDRDIVVDAMEEKKFKPGDWVIKQGLDGNELYVVDTGELDCFKKFNNNEEPKFLKTYLQGEAFGELALLYSSPRQASIRAKTDSILWALDRDTFNNIVKDAVQKKREEYEKFLAKVDLLSEMSASERTSLCDSLKEIRCKKGDYIVRQGEQGDVFFMVEQGELVAIKVTQPGAQPEEVMQYKAGMYFGELALMSDQPRAASILCKTDCILVSLDRYTFKRMLGPVDEIMKRNAQKYQQFQSRN